MSDFLSISQVAEVLGVSEDTVTRRFARLPGVLDLGSAETKTRRRYRVLRIPRAVVEKYLSDKSGRPVRIAVPDRAEHRRRTPKWEDRATFDLAKSALVNGAKDKAVYQRIAEHARMLALYVPESEWADIMWCDDEEDEAPDRITAISQL